ncbi:MAG: hypothetical protein QXT63_00635, partial [Thermoplasmata archaeon]
GDNGDNFENEDKDVSMVRFYVDADGNGIFDEHADLKLGAGQLIGGKVNIPFAEAYKISQDETKIFFAVVDVPPDANKGNTFGLELSEVSTRNGYVSLGKSVRQLSYISVPSKIVIDGAFADWAGLEELKDEINDVKKLTLSTPGKGNSIKQKVPNIDISGIKIAKEDTSISFYIRVEGEMMSGSAVLDLPNMRFLDTSNTVSQTSSETEAEIILPVAKGEDLTQIFLDTDDNAKTGYNYSGLGADYLIQISGKNGIVKESNLSKYEDGAWKYFSDVDVGIDEHRLETQVLLSRLGIDPENGNGIVSSRIKAAFKTTSWSGAFDEYGNRRSGDRLYPTGLVWINEISPGGKWVELWCNSTSDVSIQNWYLYGVNANRWYRLTGTISAKSYRVFLSVSWLLASDTLILFSPNPDPNGDPYVTEDYTTYNINPSVSNWGRDNNAGDGMGSWTTTSLDTQGERNEPVVVSEFDEILLPVFVVSVSAVILINGRKSNRKFKN